MDFDFSSGVGAKIAKNFFPSTNKDHPHVDIIFLTSDKLFEMNITSFAFIDNTIIFVIISLQLGLRNENATVLSSK